MITLLSKDIDNAYKNTKKNGLSINEITEDETKLSVEDFGLKYTAVIVAIAENSLKNFKSDDKETSTFVKEHIKTLPKLLESVKQCIEKKDVINVPANVARIRSTAIVIALQTIHFSAWNKNSADYQDAYYWLMFGMNSVNVNKVLEETQKAERSIL
jgi:hypothetical protein